MAEITKGMLDNMSLDEVEALNTQMEADLTEMHNESERRLVLQDLEEKERLEEMIGVLKTDDFLTMDIKGIEVRIQRTLTRAQRRDIVNLDKKRKDMAPDEMDEEMYKFLADIALESPFDRKEFWEKLDEETGKILKIYMEANELLLKEIESVRGFRDGKRPSARRNVPDDRRTEKPERA